MRKPIEMLNIMWPAALGALLQEALWWWNMRRVAADGDFIKIVSSIRYWLTVSVFVILAALVAVVWFDQKVDPSKRDVLVFGAFLPLILKQAGKAVLSGQDLGTRGVPASAKNGFSVAKYLR